MIDADKVFTQATDDIIALYRSIERSTLDLPLVSAMPLLIFFWALLKFYFFFVVGIFLIIPTNLLILIRNFFPGRWRYRPFFFRHLYYIWLWISRGEAPTAPLIFIRPLLNLFIKGHFERRLRRMRIEILLRGGLSETTRSALLGRFDAALEQWKTPRFGAVFFSVLLPGIISSPTLYKQLIDFLGSFRIHMPTDIVVNFVSNLPTRDLLYFGGSGLGYLVAIPITAFLAKRGLFLGTEPERICFPGGQGGSGAYLKEKEILGKLGLHAREMPLDLWLVCATLVPSVFYLDYFRADFLANLRLQIQSGNFDQQLESEVAKWYDVGFFLPFLIVGGLTAVAAFRRKRTCRA